VYDSKLQYWKFKKLFYLIILPIGVQYNTILYSYIVQRFNDKDVLCEQQSHVRNNKDFRETLEQRVNVPRG